MMPESVRLVQIWSGWLRLTHWLIAVGVLFELFSAWTVSLGAADPGFWRDWHLMIGQLTGFALLLRVVLLFVPGTSYWRALLPRRNQWQAIGQMLRFYLSLGRAPLPAWYAHNPLWAPLYLLVLACLLAAVLSGMGYESSAQQARLHAVLGQLLAWFCLLHVLAAAVHDWKSDGALVSALFSGKRCFTIRQLQPGNTTLPVPGITVDLTLLQRAAKNGQQEHKP